MPPSSRRRSRLGGDGALSVSQPAAQAASKGAVTAALGHVATVGAALPSSAPVIEVRESGRARGDIGMRLQAAIDQVLPPPGRYRAVWSARGPLTMWMPVPPTADFVALGMVATATTSAQPPPQAAIRCVPQSWVRRVPAVHLVWQGTEGSIWGTSHGLLVAAKGRQPPQVNELITNSFRLDGYK